MAALIIVLLIGGGIAWYAYEMQHDEFGIDANNVALIEQGRELYARQCAVCHGGDLEGQTPNWRQRLPNGQLPAPPHDASGHTWHHPDPILFEVTKYGRLRAAEVTIQSTMPAFENILDDGEIWAVLSYIKSRWPADIRQRHDLLNEQYRAAR